MIFSIKIIFIISKRLVELKDVIVDNVYEIVFIKEESSRNLFKILISFLKDFKTIRKINLSRV